MKRIRLLATDFDGTLYDPLARLPAGNESFAQLRVLIHQFRFQHRLKWAVITGRHVESIPAVAGELLLHGLVPDFLVMEDAHIFVRHRHRYRPFWWWNLCLRFRRRRQLRSYRPRVRQLKAETERRHPGIEDLTAGRLIDYWYAFNHEADASAVEEELRHEFDGNPDFFVFRWGLEVCLVPTAGTKGEAVKRLAATLKATPAEIATVGDGPNDISMLNGSCAAHVACVGNADAAVRDTVRRAGGLVSQEPTVFGVLEFLQQLYAAAPPPARRE
ncbi:MAG: HAD family hydrolase [Lentisphaeria bacterium]|jgi:HAD superfamily hydrolase (TIGR01484 family)